MASKIAYQFELVGIDSQIAKLQKMKSLINDIIKGGGSVGGGGNININQGGTNAVPPNIPGNNGGATALTGASMIANPAFREKLNKASNTLFNILSKQLDEATKHLEYTLKQANSLFGTSGSSAAEKAYQEALKFHSIKSKEFNRMYPSGKPNIRPTDKVGASGAYKDLFTKLFGAGAGKAGSKLDALGGIFTKFGPVLLAVYAGFKILQAAIHLLAIGIKAASDAYTSAARAGMSVSKNTKFQEAASMLGINIESAELQGIFKGGKNAKKTNVSDADMVLGAARAGQLADANALLNMSKEFKETMSEIEGDAKLLENSSKANLEISIEAKEVGFKFKTTMAMIAEALEPLIFIILELTKAIMTLLQVLAGGVIVIWRSIKAVFTGDWGSVFGGEKSSQSFTNKVGKTGAKTSNVGSLEKLGLQFNSGFVFDAQTHIVKNTFKTADTLGKIHAQLDQMKIDYMNASTNSIPNYP